MFPTCLGSTYPMGSPITSAERFSFWDPLSIIGLQLANKPSQLFETPAHMLLDI